MYLREKSVNVKRLNPKDSVYWNFNKKSEKDAQNLIDIIETLRLSSSVAYDLATEVLRLNTSGELLSERKVAALQKQAREIKQGLVKI